MKRLTNLILILAITICSSATDFTDVSVTLDNREAVFNNGKLIIKVGSNGRVSSLKYNTSHELLGSTGIYFDITNANGNKSMGVSSARIVKNTPELCEVVYSGTSAGIEWEQGYIVRKGVSGIYTYIVATGTSSSEPIWEGRVVSRMRDDMLQGYVDYRMNGKMPSRNEMAVAETKEIQDATYYLADGSVYTKYNWANYVERDTIHGLSNGYYGLWNIPVSYEWINGGCERQELMTHATSSSPLSIQMWQGSHFMGNETCYLTLAPGQKKLYGPFLIYANMKTPKITGPINDAFAMAAQQKEEWPFQWFEHELYPRERGTLKGRIVVTTGQSADSVRVILAQEKGKEPYQQANGYQFWTDTDKDGNFTIPKVRPGVYHLYAYAKKGDITDMLEYDDITVSAGENNIGEVKWTPTRYSKLLWQIGENNRRSDEFHYSDTVRQYGLWKLIPASTTFTVGTSDPKKDWYYAQCKSGTWTVKFNLDEVPTGSACITASLAGCTGAGTTVAVKVNGTQVDTWKPGVNDAAIYRSAVNGGRHWKFSKVFSKSYLRKGQNTVTFTMSGNGSNGGFLYDCVKLEAGELIKVLGDANNDGIVDKKDADAVTATYEGNKPTVFNAAQADMNNDGIITVSDANAIVNKYVK